MSKQGSTKPGYLYEALTAGRHMHQLAFGTLPQGARQGLQDWLTAMEWEQCNGCLDKVTGTRRSCYETGWHVKGAGGA